jgi:hypothetical protein
MTMQHNAAPAEIEKEALRTHQNDRLMETLHILADGSLSSRQLLDNLLSQYSWDGYVNELEFE